MGLLDNLKKFGIKDIDTEHMYEKKESAPVKKTQIETKAAEIPTEESFLYKKKYACPICDGAIDSLTCKSNSLRLLKMDTDLRPQYLGIDPIKYEPVVCPRCGYGVMSRYFADVTSRQRKEFIDAIGSTFDGHVADEFVVSYEQALFKFELVLASCIVKGTKASEKAYVCLKGGWLCRGYIEAIESGEASGDEAKIEELKGKEMEFLEAAYDGFLQARQTEMFPIAGMDEGTLDYVLAALAFNKGNLEDCGKMLSKILVSPSSSNKLKERARTLKDELAKKKKADEA